MMRDGGHWNNENIDFNTGRYLHTTGRYLEKKKESFQTEQLSTHVGAIGDLGTRLFTFPFQCSSMID